MSIQEHRGTVDPVVRDLVGRGWLPQGGGLIWQNGELTVNFFRAGQVLHLCLDTAPDEHYVREIWPEQLTD